ILSMVKSSDNNIWSPGMMPFWCSHNAVAAAAAVDFTAGGDKQSMLHQTTFDALPAQSFYPPRWPAPPTSVDTYPEQPRWGSDHVYPMFPFVQSESYPSDPFPSTSMAGPMEYKVNAFYPNTILGSGYPNDYNQSIQWKMPSMKPAKPSMTNPPYRTGPGTNNVRVRTSDKYRMVYSDYQRLELEKEFCTSTFVTSERKAELSTLLNLTERQIKIWFQNR
ncbi:Homeobox protein pal-1, partial [Trichostrongylus colubriformis]